MLALMKVPMIALVKINLADVKNRFCAIFSSLVECLYYIHEHLI